jgi:SAM-dependent methyltransferase
MAIEETHGTRTEGLDWHQAGEAWGRSAADWACFFEHYSIDTVLAIFRSTGLGRGTRLLDVACGSGLVARLAAGAGVSVAGIDAAADLIEIARARAPDVDFRIGSMYELPWDDEEFDVVTAINGIWGGCDAALHEVFRVLRRDGLVGVSFWGSGPPLDLRPCFKVFARRSPEAHFQSMRSLNDISTVGVAEGMLESAGFEVLGRGQRVAYLEWPDPDTAWRAVSSIGPAVPALRGGDVDGIRAEVLAAMEPCRDERGIYRFRNDHQYVLARKP